MSGGRPTLVTPELTAAAWHYVNGGWQEANDPVPSIAGLACEIGVHRETLRLWGKDQDNPFFGILCKVAETQERELVRGGLSGGFNSSITKMILTKHGYSDRVETDHTSSDGSMTPNFTVRIIRADEEDDDA
jgi:hypothetical protein